MPRDRERLVRVVLCPSLSRLNGRLSWKCPVLTHSRAFPPAVWLRLPSVPNLGPCTSPRCQQSIPALSVQVRPANPTLVQQFPFLCTSLCGSRVHYVQTRWVVARRGASPRALLCFDNVAPSGTFYVRHSRFAYLPKPLETECVQSSDTRLVKIVDMAIPFTYTSTMACERDVR